MSEYKYIQEHLNGSIADWHGLHSDLVGITKEITALREQLAGCEKVRAEWFEKGRQSALACKECCCVFDEHGKLERLCKAHADAFERREPTHED